jgi:hypothetical protein
MSGSDEARRVALESRDIVRAVGEVAREDSRRGAAIRRDSQTVRAMISEEMAWALLGGVEPRLNMDREGIFYTLTGLKVLGRDGSMDLLGLFGKRPTPEGLLPMQKESLDPTIPERRWREFLSSDERALSLLSELEDLAEKADVPDDFSLPLSEHRSEGESLSDAAQRSQIVALKERVRSLTWLLTSADEECLERAAEVSRRRNRFVWGSDGGPWADR